MHTQTHLKRRKMQRGQSMVEFALAFPIFLLIVLAIFEFGRMVFTYATVFTASREAARYGATVTTATDCEGMEAAANNIAIFTDVSDIMIYYDKGDTPLQTIAQAPDPVTAISGYNLPECGELTDDEIVLGDRIIIIVSSPFSPILGPLFGIDQEFTIFNLVSRTLVKKVEWDVP